MTYNLTIDQEFAILNDLSLVQVSTLAAFMTLPIWVKTVAIDGYVWYQYSEEKMAEDFPLLFGCPKRCYKNVSELADMGFVELTKLGRVKYVRFTGRCASWNKQKEQMRTESPKTDQISPKTDQSNNNITLSNRDNNYNIKTNDIDAADGGLFPPESTIPVIVKQSRRKPKCLFEDSEFADFEKFKAQFPEQDFADIDLFYYYNRIKNWSGANAKKKANWILTAKNWMMDDAEKGKLHRLSSGSALSPEAIEYLQNMAD